MWDLQTIVRINQKAAEQARQGKPERDALFLATGVRDVSKPNLLIETGAQIVTLPEAGVIAEAA
jgi:hypothetical protein